MISCVQTELHCTQTTTTFTLRYRISIFPAQRHLSIEHEPRSTSPTDQPHFSTSVNDRTASISKGWCDTLMSSNLGFWLCDRNHISIDKYPGLIGMVQGNADPGFWSCDRNHMIGELAGPDQVHQSNIPVSHPILRLSQLAPKTSGRTVPFLP